MPKYNVRFEIPLGKAGDLSQCELPYSGLIGYALGALRNEGVPFRLKFLPNGGMTLEVDILRTGEIYDGLVHEVLRANGKETVAQVF